MDQQQLIFAVIFIGAFYFYRKWKFSRSKMLLPELLKKGGVIVDVRSPAEFQMGANPRSRNIPLGELETRLKELDSKCPVIVCCASGARSAQAKMILERAGFSEVLNVGPWANSICNE